jgi:hypothetical protein
MSFNIKSIKFFWACLFFTLANLQLSAQDLENVSKAKTLGWTGSIGSNLTTYSVRGIDRRMNPMHYNFFGNFNIKIKEEFDIPLSFTYNQFGLDVQKPFYQFGISPKYKKIQLHLGHRNMFFNNYSLSGHTFYGVGVEFNPGKFRFSAMKGRLREPLLLDQTQTQSFTNPQFKRSGWGVKVGVGSFRNHLDLMVFKAKDEANSIENWQEPVYQSSISGQTGKFAPAENLIFGITTKWSLYKNITWGVEAGASLYSDDLNKENVDFNMPFFDLKRTSVLKYAGKTNINIPMGPLTLNAAYERVLPDYFSMGMYNFINDMENITLSPSINLFSGKLFMNGMIGIQRNNLDGSRSETTKRLINNYNLTFAPKPEYGITLNYTNFSFNQQPQAILLSDTVLIKQINTSLAIMPYYNISKDSTSQQSLNSAIIFQNAEDLNPVTRQFGSMNTMMITANYTLNNSRGIVLGGGLNYTQINSAIFKNTLQGLTVQIGKNIPKSEININLSSQLNATSVDGESDGVLVSTGLNGGIILGQKHNFRINLNWLKSNSKKFDSYSELIFNMGYTFQIN